MLRVTVLERGRLIRSEDTADSGEREMDTPSRRHLPAPLYDRLLRAEVIREERNEAPVFGWRRDYCLVGPWVGVMQIPGLQIEILPKTDGRDVSTDETFVEDTRGNLMEMLFRGGVGAVRARGLADLSLKRGNLYDQLVDTFLDRSVLEFRRGLDRGYRVADANLNTLRGKLLLSRHIARNSARKHRFYCRHDVLSEDTQISIRIKQACQLIAGRRMPAKLHAKCQQVLVLLSEVPDQPINKVVVDPVFNRQNERFEDIYTFACMLLEGQAPDARAGDSSTFSLLFEMEKVFERYIAAFLERHVVANDPTLSLYPQGRGYQYGLLHDSDGQRAILHMKPDLLLFKTTDKDPKTLIIDTKWKRLPENKPSRPDDKDLYQLYAYLNRYGCDRVVLLYPQTAGVAQRDFVALRGSDEKPVGSIGVRFVDLRHQLWTVAGKTELARQLEVIVREGFDPAALSQAKPLASVAGGTE